MTTRAHIAVAFIGLVLGAGSPASAASDGALGPVSIGSLDVTLTIASQVRVSGLNDIGLGSHDGSADIEGNDDLCIFSNAGSGYQITVTDDGSLPDGFAIETESGSTQLPIEAYFSGSLGPDDRVALSKASPAAFEGAATDCETDGGNANFSVRVTAENASAAPLGVYSGTFTLLVEPD